MSLVQISGNASGTGTLTIAAPNTNSNYTLTLPAATGTLGVGPQIQSLSASVASNILTISTSALSLDFRSTTLGSGTVTTVSGTPATLNVPANQSFGISTTTVTNRYAVLCFNNAGTLALALSPLQGSVQLDETNLLSPTSTTTNTLTTIYSTVTASSIAYRVIGFVDVLYVNGTGYTTAPSLIQGYGGQAFDSASSLGYGQTWQTVTRTSGTTYYNTTGKPIQITAYAGANVNCSININGVGLTFLYSAGNSTAAAVVIPISASYAITDNVGARAATYELR